MTRCPSCAERWPERDAPRRSTSMLAASVVFSIPCRDGGAIRLTTYPQLEDAPRGGGDAIGNGEWPDRRVGGEAGLRTSYPSASEHRRRGDPLRVPAPSLDAPVDGAGGGGGVRARARVPRSPRGRRGARQGAAPESLTSRRAGAAPRAAVRGPHR